MSDYATQIPGSRGNPTPPSSRTGIDISTLFYTAAASAVAAYTCSKLWAPGTLAAAAFTPVLVAIIKEALAKSTEVVTRAVPVRGVVRSATPQGPQPYEPPATAHYDPVAGQTYDPTGTVVAPGPPGSLAREPVYADAGGPLPGAADPADRVPQAGEISYHGGGRNRRNWRLAIVTGLLGFLVCAVVFTVPELMAGGSAAGGGRDTTLFGGKERDRSQTVTETTTTQTQTVTQPKGKTVTVPAPIVTTTVPPANTTTTPPQTTTTAPPAQPGAPVVTEPPAAQPPQ
jgi:hypothetical protein